MYKSCTQPISYVPQKLPKAYSSDEEKVRRNKDLAECLKEILQQDTKKFKRFKKFSQQFQKGEVSVNEYYHFFMDLIDARSHFQRAEHLLMLLIALLPGKKKRASLHRVYAEQLY